MTPIYAKRTVNDAWCRAVAENRPQYVVQTPYGWRVTRSVPPAWARTLRVDQSGSLHVTP